MINLSRYCLSLILLLLSLSAIAERADRDKPVELEADTVTVDDAKKTSVYTGDVILTQGTLIIKGDKLIVREDSQGFQHGTSYGNPTTFRQKLEGKDEYMSGSAQRIEYDGRMDKVQLYTKAWVKAITSCTTPLPNMPKLSAAAPTSPPLLHLAAASAP